MQGQVSLLAIVGLPLAAGALILGFEAAWRRWFGPERALMLAGRVALGSTLLAGLLLSLALYVLTRRPDLAPVQDVLWAAAGRTTVLALHLELGMLARVVCAAALAVALAVQIAALGDPQRQRRIAALQEAQHGLDGGDAGLAVRQEAGDGGRRRRSLGSPAPAPAASPDEPPRARRQLVEDLLQAGAREQPQEQLEREVGLRDLDVGRVAAQAAGQVRRRRVRRVHLRHRRGDQEEPHRGRRA